MEWLIFLCLSLSSLNLYFLLKKKSQSLFEKEFNDFKLHTESLIVEFNRITNRNISLLDERIEELTYKIRSSKKIENVLKKTIEEIQQTQHFEELDAKMKVEKKKISAENKLINAGSDTENKLIKDDLFSEKTNIFEGIPTEKLQTYKNNSSCKNKERSILLYYLEDNIKTKEELIDMGFSLNEINLASINLKKENI